MRESETQGGMAPPVIYIDSHHTSLFGYHIFLFALYVIVCLPVVVCPYSHLSIVLATMYPLRSVVELSCNALYIG